MKKCIIVALCAGLVLGCSPSSDLANDFPPEAPVNPGNPGENPGDNGGQTPPDAGGEVPDDNGGTGGTIGGIVSGSFEAFDVNLDAINADSSKDVAINTSDETYGEDYEVDSFTTEISIVYSGTTATVTGIESKDTLASAAGNSHVILKLGNKNLNIKVSGSTTNGSLKIYSQKKYALQLDNLSMKSSSSSCLNLQSSKRAYISLIGQNSLTDANSYSTTSGEDEKGCIFSEGKLIFYGTGSLSIAGNTKHAIASDDYVHIYGGDITISSAAKDGVHVNDAFFMERGSLTINGVGSDGVECEEGEITINGGLIKAQIDADGGKGLKSTGNTTINGGTIGIITKGNAYLDSSSSPADVKGVAGIKSDGELKIANANVYVKSTGTGGKGLNSDGAMTINDGSVIDVITTGKRFGTSTESGPGRPSNGDSSTSSSAKGICSEGNVTFNGGVTRVMATGGENSEGVESKNILTFNGGTVMVSAYDDAINSSSNITVNGGNVYCYSSNNDGLDSNGTITITGGLVVSSGTTSPEEGFDCDNNAFVVKGGTILGIGGATSTPTSVQQSVLKYGGSGSAGSYITVATSTGAIIGSYCIPRTYQQMTMLFSSPDLTSGSSFTIYSGGEITPSSTGTSFCGLTTKGSISGGTSLGTFNASSSSVSSVGSSSSQPGGGRW